MLRKYNRKFIHNMPRLAFPVKPHTARGDKRAETPEQEVVKPVENTRKNKPVKPTVKTEISEIKYDQNDIARTEG